MHFLALAAFAAVAMAAPAAEVTARDFIPCPSLLYSNAVCCGTDVLGVADLNCLNVPQTPKSAEDFRDLCAGEGQEARCCAVPILGQGLLCDEPVGV